MTVLCAEGSEGSVGVTSGDQDQEAPRTWDAALLCTR